MSGFRFRPVRADEVGLATEHGHEAFSGEPADLPLREALYRQHLQAGELWGVEGGDGELLGHCRLLITDHWFGHRPVPCMDVAGVAVPKVHRHRGVATAMMEGAVAWGTHRGLGMSVLYGYVPQLYRPLGWEQAGTLPEHRFDATVDAPAAEPMRPAHHEDWAAIVDCHERFAALRNGPGRRRHRRWSQLQEGRAFVLPAARGVDAFLVVEPGDDTEPPSADWAAVTPRGLRAVTAMLKELAGEQDILVHSPPHPWGLHAQRWDIPATTGRYWMARPLLLPAAVSARGFPTAVTAATTFAVDDPLVPENRGPWQLTVSDGKGELTPARDAEVIADVHAIGPLFTGFLSASQLAMAALLDGPEPELAALDAMFAGTPPVMLDFF